MIARSHLQKYQAWLQTKRAIAMPQVLGSWSAVVLDQYTRQSTQLKINKHQISSPIATHVPLMWSATWFSVLFEMKSIVGAAVMVNRPLRHDSRIAVDQVTKFRSSLLLAQSFLLNLDLSVDENPASSLKKHKLNICISTCETWAWRQEHSHSQHRQPRLWRCDAPW